MLNKKGILLLCLCLSMVMLAGCSYSTKLTTEDQDKIAEYSAGLLLQHYAKYSRRLIKPEEASPQAAEDSAGTMSPTETISPTEQGQTQSDNTVDNYTTGTGGSGTGSTTAGGSASAGEEGNEEEIINEVSLQDLYHVAGMNVSYDSYVVCKEYPKKSSAVKLTAKKGQRLFVVRFDLKNETSKKLKVKLDRKKRDIKYSLDVDGAVYSPSMVMQANGGMNNLNTSLKAGGSEKAVLVFEIPKASQNPGSAVLTVKEGDNASVVRLTQ